jgi:hypothetical protein
VSHYGQGLSTLPDDLTKETLAQWVVRLGTGVIRTGGLLAKIGQHRGTVLPNFCKNIGYLAIDTCVRVPGNNGANTVLHPITSRSMDQAQRLHFIADQIWDERNWTPRDTLLWATLNEMATTLHDAAAEIAKETQRAMAPVNIPSQERVVL